MTFIPRGSRQLNNTRGVNVPTEALQRAAEQGRAVPGVEVTEAENGVLFFDKNGNMYGGWGSEAPKLREDKRSR